MTAPHTTSPAKQRHLKAIAAQYKGHTLAAQRRRLLDALAIYSITTVEARRDLDICVPSARIWELRHIDGVAIETHWINSPTESGRVHRIALYVKGVKP